MEILGKSRNGRRRRLEGDGLHMKSENQDIWIQSMIDQLNEEDRLFCRPVINRLLELGYTSKKHKKSTFTVSFEKNGRIISKMEVGRNTGILKT